MSAAANAKRTADLSALLDKNLDINLNVLRTSTPRLDEEEKPVSATAGIPVSTEPPKKDANGTVIKSQPPPPSLLDLILPSALGFLAGWLIVYVFVRSLQWMGYGSPVAVSSATVDAVQQSVQSGAGEQFATWAVQNNEVVELAKSLTG